MRTQIPSRVAAAVLAAMALAVSGCTLDKQDAPSLIGPSGPALSLLITATPDVLPRDGTSMSTVTIRARDPEGKPVIGQRLVVGTSAGTLSQTEVTTDSNGTATFGLIAPANSQGVTSALITATPIGTNFDNSASRTLSVALSGPSVPTASYTFSPSSPGQYDLVVFTGSSTLDGSACSTCSYAWDFGDSSTATGQTATHRYGARGSYVATLTVTSAAGVKATSSKTISIGAAQAITAAITVSPTNPKVGDTVYFDGRGSTTPDGVSISSYAWDFGNGGTATESTASTTYDKARIFTVRLTVTDTLGRTGTTTTTVTVAAP